MHHRRRRILAAVGLVLVALASGCRDREPGRAPAAALTDLDASLEPLRASFNAHRRQVRFLTLLAPT